MRWLKRDRWKAGITLVGMLLFLVLMVWVPVSTAGAYEGASGLATPVPGAVQATPTVDATVAALNKAKLEQEIQQLKYQNDHSPAAWFWNFSSLLGPIVAALLAIAGVLWTTKVAQDKNLADSQAERTRRDEEQTRWLGDHKAERERRDEEQQRWLKNQEAEREKRSEERFQSVVEGLGSTSPATQAGAAIMLRTFLQSGYEQFYQQAFDLAVANLRLRHVDPDKPEPLDALSQALIMVFKEAFPRARSLYPKGPLPLVARGIQLDNAYLEEADLKQVWMPQASLREADLSQADLSQADLSQADLRKAKLRKANLRKANLREANLHGADLQGAALDQADLRGADLREAHLQGAECTRADLTGANLTDADLTQMIAVEATLIQAFLEKASLVRANLMKANLAEARLMKADLTEANLVEANLSGVYLIAARLTDTDFTRADLTNANLSQSNLEDAPSLKSYQLHSVKGLTTDQLKDYAYHRANEWSIFDDIVASPDRPSSLPEGPQSQNDTTPFFPATSTQEGHPSPPPSSQSNDTQASPAPLVQGSTPTPGTDGSSATSSKPDTEP